MKRIIIVPTFNESKNIEKLLTDILKQKISDMSVLVVDDSSPDGTSEIVKAMAANYPNLILLQRVGLKGRGTAGIAGFELAMRLGAEEILEMDADFSHPPDDLPRMFEGLSKADIVIASRLCEGAVDTRPALRRYITVLANLYARFWLESDKHQSKLSDWTTGYRAYKRKIFEKVPPCSMVSYGPSIVQELLYRALNAGCTAIEIPFTMIDRAEGKSSFSPKVARQSLASIPAYRVIFNPQFEVLSTAVVEFEKQSEKHYFAKRMKV